MPDTHKTLNDGTRIPRLGLGVWKATDGDEVSAVRHALGCGYRHIDTAKAYDNETGVGRGIVDSGVPRDEIFLTSKIWNDDIRAGTTARGLDGSLERLGTDYLDLILLHWPTEGRVDAWRALVAARDAGKVKSIGVSNFLPEHLDEIVEATGVVPVLNQIEHHPRLTQPAIREACEGHGIAIEAWSPLMQGDFDSLDAVGSIAESTGRTPAQVVLRWALQRDAIVIPKSVTPSRIEENAQVFDFELDDEAMRALDACDDGHRYGPDPHDFSF